MVGLTVPLHHHPQLQACVAKMFLGMVMWEACAGALNRALLSETVGSMCDPVIQEFCTKRGNEDLGEKRKEREPNSRQPLERQSHGEGAKEDKRVIYFNPLFNKLQLPRKKPTGPKNVRTEGSQEFHTKRNSTAG